MTEKISGYIIDNIIYKNEKIETQEKEIMIFGMTRILEDLPKFIIIILICFTLGFLKELAIVFVITTLYKTFVGGAHCKTNLECLLFSLIYFLLPIILAKSLIYDSVYLYILTIATFIYSLVVITKAPYDTEEIPIIKKEKRKKLQTYARISICLMTLITMLFIKNPETIKIIIYTVLLINIFTSNKIYKFLRCKHGYESIEYKDSY